MFNQTFRLGQRVIYPDNWYTGKTILQQFQETKQTIVWIVVSTILQFIVAFLWILMLYTTAKGAYELWIVWRLPSDSIKRSHNKKLLKAQIIYSIAFLVISLFTLTIFIMIRVKWIRQNIFYGFAAWILVLVVRRIAKIFGLFKSCE